MGTRSIVAVVLAVAGIAGTAVAAGLPPTGGTIAIVDGAGADAVPAPFAAALSAALTARGFTPFPDAGHAAYVATVRVTQAEVGTGPARVQGQRKASVAGAGLVVPFSSGASDLVPLRRTQLDLAIRRRGVAGAWTAGAVTVRQASARDGSDDAVATDLARALVAAYPVPQHAVIGVP